MNSSDQSSVGQEEANGTCGFIKRPAGGHGAERRPLHPQPAPGCDVQFGRSQVKVSIKRRVGDLVLPNRTAAAFQVGPGELC